MKGIEPPSQHYKCRIIPLYYTGLKLVAVARIELVLHLMRVMCAITLPRNKTAITGETRFGNQSPTILSWAAIRPDWIIFSFYVSTVTWKLVAAKGFEPLRTSTLKADASANFALVHTAI